ncbi:MAG: sigma-70 family RNA polymerase sigma factor [Xanthobacteraceae bacterium]|uniref:sigma-70 family RNA polymerase sigma factor n=1 Tax=Pseudolabrys sp. TaxID=1960880 RepID=UPI003D0EA61D
MRKNNDDIAARQQAGPGDASGLIVAMATTQDRAAFAQLFELYAPRIKAWLMRRGATADAAEETAQDALLLIWRKAAMFDPGRATAAAWIFTIARNLQIDKLRREARERRGAVFELAEPDRAERPDDVFDVRQTGEKVRAALATLSPEQIAVVQLSFFEGVAHGEIARTLKIPLGTVKSRLRLAMQSLRGQLDQ